MYLGPKNILTLNFVLVNTCNKIVPQHKFFPFALVHWQLIGLCHKRAVLVKVTAFQSSVSGKWIFNLKFLRDLFVFAFYYRGRFRCGFFLMVFPIKKHCLNKGLSVGFLSKVFYNGTPFTLLHAHFATVFTPFLNTYISFSIIQTSSIFEKKYLLSTSWAKHNLYTLIHTPYTLHFSGIEWGFKPCSFTLSF